MPGGKLIFAFCTIILTSLNYDVQPEEMWEALINPKQINGFSESSGCLTFPQRWSVALKTDCYVTTHPIV